MRSVQGFSLIVVATAFLAACGNEPTLGVSTGAVRGSKVTLCHHTSSAKNPTVTITVNESAVNKHLSQHGDTIGACETAQECVSAGGPCAADAPCCDGLLCMEDGSGAGSCRISSGG